MQEIRFNTEGSKHYHPNHTLYTEDDKPGIAESKKLIGQNILIVFNRDWFII